MPTSYSKVTHGRGLLADSEAINADSQLYDAEGAVYAKPINAWNTINIRCNDSTIKCNDRWTVTCAGTLLYANASERVPKCNNNAIPCNSTKINCNGRLIHTSIGYS